MAEHSPSVVIEIDVFPEDSFLLSGDEKAEMGVQEGDEAFEDSYTPEQVAREAWFGQVAQWVENGYLPIVTVLMPDGSEHEVDLERADG